MFSLKVQEIWEIKKKKLKVFMFILKENKTKYML